MRKVRLFCIVLLVCGACVHAGLDAMVNSSFEDPALDLEAKVAGVTDWFDSVAYTFTQDDAAATHPETPYGENWAEMGNERWIYQQIGTYEENMELDISFLLGQRSNKVFQGVHVSVLVGGDPSLAEDINSKYFAAGNPLVTVVGAVEIANSGAINPFATADMGVSEQVFSLTTGTGYTVGDPMWVQFNKITGTGRVLVDNVNVALVPEPASMSMLVIGALGLIRRKRK